LVHHFNCDPPGQSQLWSPGDLSHPSGAVLDAARFYHEMEPPRWFIHCFLLMPDHLHAILSFPREASLRQTLASWKGYVKRHCGIVWQSDFFDHRLRNSDERSKKMEYIRMNPVRKGLCKRWERWPPSLAFDPRSGEPLEW